MRISQSSLTIILSCPAITQVTHLYPRNRTAPLRLSDCPKLIGWVLLPTRSPNKRKATRTSFLAHFECSHRSRCGAKKEKMPHPVSLGILMFQVRNAQHRGNLKRSTPSNSGLCVFCVLFLSLSLFLSLLLSLSTEHGQRRLIPWWQNSQKPI